MTGSRPAARASNSASAESSRVEVWGAGATSGGGTRFTGSGADGNAGATGSTCSGAGACADGAGAAYGETIGVGSVGTAVMPSASRRARSSRRVIVCSPSAVGDSGTDPAAGAADST